MTKHGPFRCRFRAILSPEQYTLGMLWRHRNAKEDGRILFKLKKETHGQHYYVPLMPCIGRSGCHPLLARKIGYIVARVAPYPRRLFVRIWILLGRVRVEVTLCFRNEANYREGVIRVVTDSPTLCDIRKNYYQCNGLNPSCKHGRFPSSTAVSVALSPNAS